MRLSIVMPVLDQAAEINAALAALAALRAAGHPLIVVDCGSRDGTSGVAALLATLTRLRPQQPHRAVHGQLVSTGATLLPGMARFAPAAAPSPRRPHLPAHGDSR